MNRNHKVTFNEVVGAIFIVISLFVILTLSLESNNDLMTQIVPMSY